MHYKGPDIPDFVLLLAYTTHKFGCDECAFGKYKTAPGDGVCALCAAGKFSAVTGLVSNVCACNSGTTGPNRFGAYPSCSVGTYKTNSGSAACTACGAGKFSAVTSSVLNVCDCNAGSTGPTGRSWHYVHHVVLASTRQTWGRLHAHCVQQANFLQ